jgi:nicotinate phosphoribosyltransferase
VEEIVYPATGPQPAANGFQTRDLLLPMVRGGKIADDRPTLQDARDLVARGLVSLPWEGLKLSPGEPAIPTTFLQ